MSSYQSDKERIHEYTGKYAPTFACWDVLCYLSDEGPIRTTLEEMREATGHPTHALDEAIDMFAQKGLLDEKWSAEGCEYRLTPTPQQAQEIKDFEEMLQDPSLRLEAVKTILVLKEGGTA